MRIVTLRAVILGLVLIPVNCYWTTIAEVGWSIGDYVHFVQQFTS